MCVGSRWSGETKMAELSQLYDNNAPMECFTKEPAINEALIELMSASAPSMSDKLREKIVNKG